MIQMAIVGFIKNKYQKKEALIIYQAYKNIVNGSALRYTYIWYRAKLVVLLGKLLHLQ